MPTTTDEARATFTRAVQAVQDDHPDLSLREAYDLTRRHASTFDTFAAFAAYQRRDGRQLAPPPTDEATDDADHVRSEIESLFDELSSHHHNPLNSDSYSVYSAATIGRQARKARQTIEATPSLQRHRKRRNPPESTIPPTDSTT